MTRSGRTLVLSKLDDFMLFLEEPPEFEAWERMIYGGVGVRPFLPNRTEILWHGKNGFGLTEHGSYQVVVRIV